MATQKFPMKAAALPNLPGWRSDHHAILSRPSFNKIQAMEQIHQSGKSGDLRDRAITRPTSERRQLMGSLASTPRSSTSNQVEATTGIVTPAWLAQDKDQVLTFAIYFIEKIPRLDYGSFGPPQEPQELVDRVRKLTLSYYCVDRSISMYENSDCGRGKFMNRTTPENPLEPSDFNIGQTLEFYGRQFHIVDADGHTRRYYHDRAALKDLAPAHSYPSDPTQASEEARARYLTAAVAQNQQTRSSLKPPKRRQNQRHQVLRFYCTWNDPHPTYPETRRVVLHYYLVDDTIEVLAAKETNSGRDPFPMLLSRRPITREPQLQQPSLGEEERTRKHVLITDQDLLCGGQLRVFERVFDIVDCDARTKQYYLETYGITQEPVLPAPKPDVPEATDFAEDHGIFRRMLEPKAVKKSLQELERLDNKVLRFRAKLYRPTKVVDHHREFVVTFYLGDEHLAIYEPPQRNSGVMGGKFLDKGHHFMSCSTKSPPSVECRRRFQVQDFYTGAIFALDAAPDQKLELVEADEQTLVYMENQCVQYPFSNLTLILHALVESMIQIQQGPEVSKNLRHKLQAAFVTTDQFELLIAEQFGSPLNAQQRLTLTRAFAAETHDSIDCHEFCDALSRAWTQLEPWSEEISSQREDVFMSLRRQNKSFRSILATRDGRMSKHEFVQRMIMATSPALSFAQAQSLYDRFQAHDDHHENNSDDDGLICVERFCDALYPCDFGTTSSSPKSTHSTDFSGFQTASRSSPNASAIRIQEPVAAVAAAASSSSLQDRDITALVRSKYGQSKYQLRKQLRQKDQVKSGLLNEDEFMDVMLSVSNESLTDSETFLLASTFFPQASSEINYQEFLDSVFI